MLTDFLLGYDPKTGQFDTNRFEKSVESKVTKNLERSLDSILRTSITSESVDPTKEDNFDWSNTSLPTIEEVQALRKKK